ncbi:MAG: efflux RND transporter periplasmic adaptor subunit [Candidatus Eremiobacteraeota bacterium]|nr:efflux RND transporter periplasmic adaptor subunit [Candidatus Eremiobacteraeota bacterium]MCW5866323.1 efflux RND transporter periplasmic adaptor subunit [Candidatus Eremiobacteraeota bacterium]
MSDLTHDSRGVQGADPLSHDLREYKKTGRSTAMTWALVIGLVVLAVVGLKLFAASRNAAKKPTTKATPKAVVTVSTATANYSTLPDTVVATGSVAAIDPLAVGAEVNGLKVEQIMVEEGDRVYAGQTLAVLNRSLLEAQLLQAQARLRSSQAQVSRAVQPNRPQDLLSLRAAYEQARAQATQERANLKQAEVNYASARKTAERYNKVLDEGFVTLQEASDRQAEVDRNQQLVNAARQRLQAGEFAAEQARQRMLLGQAGGRAEDVDIARASSDEISGMIAMISAQLEQTVIRAPDSGTVLKRDVHLGEISSSSKPMFTLARRGELELQAQMPQVDLLKMREGLKAQVSYGGKKVGGRIWRVSPQVESSSRLGTARIKLDPGSSLRPGMFGEARVDVGDHRALTVPAEAVLGEGGDYFVFKLEGTTAVRTRVTTGVRTNQRVEITEGLKINETVAVAGARFLADGDKVRIEEK